jgi:hypothetical protein
MAAVWFALASLLAIGDGNALSTETAGAELAQKFFDCCEKGKGWTGCSQFVINERAPFAIQAVDALPGPKVTDNKYVKDYLEWMSGVVREFGTKATYTVKAHSYDSTTNTALYYAVFMGYSDYVYMINIDPNDMKVSRMTKVWNDQYAKDHMGMQVAIQEVKPFEQVETHAVANPAQDFFDCCENGKGWAGCSQYVTNENAPFAIQAVDALPGPNVTDNKSVKDYLEWMAGVVKEFGSKATYTVKAHGFDSSANTALFFSVFMGYSDYVYSIEIDPKTKKVSSLTKMWNDQYAFNHIPGSEMVTLIF